MRIDGRFLRSNWKDAAPTGTINGSNVTFTLPSTPQESGSTEPSVDLYLDGLYQTPGTDYTISGVTITMTTAPALGQSLRASYFQGTGGT